MITPVLLCGGSGTRLWPMSRKSFPKQFANLTGDQSLFQASARRLSGKGFAPPMILTAADFRFIVREQLAATGQTARDIVIEPTPRNTAPAILAAALILHERAPGSLMLVAPSDHVIPDPAHFRATVNAGIPAARAGQIVTFGIQPDRAETGYGWLEISTPAAHATPQPLIRFVEKPKADAAAAMLQDARHLWNAGIFLFTTDTILDAFRQHAPDLIQPVKAAIDAAKPDLGFTRLDSTAWKSAPEISLDYAVMEKSSNLTVVPYDGVWSDLGGWEAVWRAAGPDLHGVVRQGPATAIDCENTLLRSDSDGLHLVGIGLKNIVAIAMPDAVLIADKDRAQDVRLAVAQLKKAGASQAETFNRDFRPWGWYESLARGPRFQVKRIVVHPGASLSLQSHHHRAEHWIVVEGTAKVTIDDRATLLSENQSVYVPVGAVHRLENPGKLPVVLIEVQTGSYLGEDDIVRYEDVYQRGVGE